MFRRQSFQVKIRSRPIAPDGDEPGLLFLKRIVQIRLADFTRPRRTLDGRPEQKIPLPLAKDEIERQAAVVDRQDV